MTATSVEQLKEMMERFVSGDRSLSLAGEIEVALDEVMGDEEPFASLVLDLASYRPEGGPFLHGEADMVPRVAHALGSLRAR